MGNYRLHKPNSDSTQTLSLDAKVLKRKSISNGDVEIEPTPNSWDKAMMVIITIVFN